MTTRAAQPPAQVWTVLFGTKGRSLALLACLVALSFAAAALGGASTAEGVRSWYPALDKPPWTPPNAAFGLIWTFLYSTMGVGAWDAARRDPKSAHALLGLFAGQLALNAIWSPLFFGAQLLLPALVVMTALWLTLAVCVVQYGRRSRVAGALYVPYLAWITVAWSLNAWIWWFNP